MNPTELKIPDFNDSQEENDDKSDQNNILGDCRGKKKRPDKKLYVPRAKRNSDSSEPKIDDQEKIGASSQMYKDEDDIAAGNKLGSNSQKTSDNTFSTGSNSSSSHEDTWDDLFDENGECLDTNLVTEFQNALSFKKDEVKLTKPKLDYLSFQPHDIEIDDNSELSHVLEVYDFASDLKTQDIITTLSVFRLVLFQFNAY